MAGSGEAALLHARSHGEGAVAGEVELRRAGAGALQEEAGCYAQQSATNYDV